MGPSPVFGGEGRREEERVGSCRSSEGREGESSSRVTSWVDGTPAVDEREGTEGKPVILKGAAIRLELDEGDRQAVQGLRQRDLLQPSSSAPLYLDLTGLYRDTLVPLCSAMLPSRRSLRPQPLHYSTRALQQAPSLEY